jgi:3-deoxy-D-glycero-D-galacto-nononate 9-phosphate synthase
MNNVYVIGEVGQNHNGSIDIAKLTIDVAARPIVDKLFGNSLKPMDAVKFTKRDLTQELSSDMMSKPYDSPHSFGRTYGEHRANLELNDEEHFELYKYAKEKGLDFVETICSPGAMSILKLFTPNRLKVASRDLTNLPLLHALAETKIPIILSTGMSGKQELDDALSVITKHHENISILHCLSEYPAQYHNVNLKSITYLKKNYPQFTIGYSDHTIGISTPIAAVAMGAKIIEKHITLDRNMKGTDQAGSLGIDGIFRMMRDIRNLEASLGVEDIFISEGAQQAKIKLERSIATLMDLPKGSVINEHNIHLLSPGDGFKWAQKDEIVGRKLSRNFKKDEIIYPKDLE